MTPSIDDTSGGVTISRALQTTTISLPALRRLRFPIDGAHDRERDRAAQTVLLALAVAAATLAREQGADLRSRCLLVPTNAFEWDLLDGVGAGNEKLATCGDEAIAAYAEAVSEAAEAGLPTETYQEGEAFLTLDPSPELLSLVKKSQELAAEVGAVDADAEGA